MLEQICFFSLWQCQGYWRRSESALRRAIADDHLRVLRHRRRVFISLDEIRRCETLMGGASIATAEDVALPLLTVEQAATLVRYRRSYLYELAAAGEMPVVRAFGSVRFRERDLHAWLLADWNEAAADRLNENRTPDSSRRAAERNGA